MLFVDSSLKPQPQPVEIVEKYLYETHILRGGGGGGGGVSGGAVVLGKLPVLGRPTCLD